jgi:hypothetical protein
MIKTNGRIKFDPDKDKGTTNYWGSEINTERMDVSTKSRICFSGYALSEYWFSECFQ